MDGHRRPRCHRSIDQISSVNRCRALRLLTRTGFSTLPFLFSLFFFFWRSPFFCDRASYRSSPIKTRTACRCTSLRRTLWNLQRRVRIPTTRRLPVYQSRSSLESVSIIFARAIDRARVGPFEFKRGCCRTELAILPFFRHRISRFTCLARVPRRHYNNFYNKHVIQCHRGTKYPRRRLLFSLKSQLTATKETFAFLSDASRKLCHPRWHTDPFKYKENVPATERNIS